MSFSRKSLLTLFALIVPCVAHAEDQLAPIKHNNPGLVVDPGVGLWAWPLPMDYDGDGDMDLVKRSGGTQQSMSAIGITMVEWISLGMEFGEK